MRHRHGQRKLNRTTSHRLAMLRNMTNSLLTHEAIKAAKAGKETPAPKATGKSKKTREVKAAA